MGFLKGKKILIVGLLSNKSIAYGIAEAMHREGAELAFTYQNERFKERIIKLTDKYNPSAIVECDVSKDEDIKNVFSELAKTWDGLDGIVHSVAYAPADQLEGDFISAVNREGFKVAHDISAYSFAALAKEARPMMQGRNGSLITLTYLGAEKAMPSYNTMGVAKASLEATVRYSALSLGQEGIRVNAVSAGPIRTLAASGIKSFRKMLDYNAEVSPLKKNVDILEVGNTVAFLASDLSSGITGEVIHVDAGYHCVSMGGVL
ncbi:enoyl-ACP reductase FabI [Fangia hongkongensis]|uniref:enoyl-ACP reductase FabI n=1 Tax=Fangia hongkongensis TaxID=270495 RepID=UPI00036F790C|nr:enoyl-ACP reductase [Fangia hongkongensis]MBK2125345.1 enoyl-ACP reductase [Fangia hongkongensis]